jgi:chorismate mutase / prephenate dehydrogenase
LDEVSRVRNEIDRIDEEMIWLLKSRYELARSLGRIKNVQGIGIRDRQREQAVLREVRGIASHLGLPTGPVHRVFLEVFEMAVEAQHDRNTRRDLQGVEVLIAGGTGGMGRLFATILANHGGNVKILSRTEPRSKRVAREIGVLPGNYVDAREADIVVVSVPVQATAKVSLKLGALMKPDSMLTDLSSVKTGIADVIAMGTKRFEYVSLHPLFGPDIAHFGRQRVAAIQYRAGPLWRKLRRVLEGEGARVFPTTVREHDMMMAETQALHHFALMSLGVSLTRASEMFSTRSLKATEYQIRRLTKNWDTIIGIQRFNPFAAEERQEFRNTVNTIARLTPRDSRKVFLTLTKHVQNWTRKR